MSEPEFRYENVHIPLARGVDTKSDPRAMPPPKLAVLENGAFDHPGGINKRPGQASVPTADVSGGTVSEPWSRGVGARQDEKLLFAEEKVWSFSDVLAKWSPRERYTGCVVDKQRLAVRGRSTPDRAQTANIRVLAYSDGTNVGYRVEDCLTGAILVETVVANATHPVARAVNGKLHVYYHVASTNDIKCDVIDPADPVGTIGTPVNMSASDAKVDFDVDVQGQKGYLAYRTTGNTVKVSEFDSAGSASIVKAVARACNGYIAISRWQTGQTGVSRVAAGTEIRHDWLKNDLTDDTNVNVLVTTGIDTITRLTCLVRQGPTATILWDDFNTLWVKRATVTGAATSAIKMFCRWAQLGSRLAFWDDGGTVGGRALVHVLHTTGVTTDIQRSAFLLDADYVIGDPNGSATPSEVMLILARLMPQTGGVAPSGTLGHIAQIESLGNNRFAHALGEFRSLDLGGVAEVEYQFADARAHHTVEAGYAAQIAGGYIAEHDGERTVENGFLLFPEITGVSNVTSIDNGLAGGLTPGDTYEYIFTYEATNKQIERSRSTYHESIHGLVGAAPHNALRCKVKALSKTMRPDSIVNIVIWRTRQGTKGPFYRHHVMPNILNADTVDFDDAIVDPALVDEDREEFYLEPTAAAVELEPVSFPASKFIASGQGRLFTLDPEDPNVIRFSKERSSGFTIHGQDALTIVVPQDGGVTTGLDVRESAIIIYKERATYLVVGDGPDNFGNNSYPPAEFIADVGCSEPKSIVRTPIGSIFKSLKGFYLCDLAYRVSYIGADVEAYNDAVIARAVHVPAKHEIHFITESSGTLVYDWRVDEWSVYPGRNGIDGALWQGSDVAVLTVDEGITVPSATFADDPGTLGYGLVVETAWIPITAIQGAMTNLQGYGRVRSATVLGEFRSPHDLRVRVAFDYKEGVYPIDKVWTPHDRAGATIMTVGPEQFQFGIQRRCQAVKIRIEDKDNARDPWREGVRLTALALEVGMSPHPMRMTATQRG